MDKINYFSIFTTHALNRLNIAVFFFSFLLLTIGRVSEALISASIIVFNIFIAVFQEVRAKQKLAKLSLKNSIVYKVIRNKLPLELNQDQIEKGDTVILSYGTQIPIDGDLITGFMRLDKSFLTGESELIDTNIKDKVYAGSNIFSGSGTMLAAGSYAESLVKEMENKGKVFGVKLTPIEEKINLLITIILFFIFCLLIISTSYLILTKTQIQTIIVVNSVISGLIPSTLLAMVTVVYSWSIAKTYIKKENLLPQKLNSYESLANVNVICFDKTGTLTTNNIELQEYVFKSEFCSELEFKKYASIFGHNVTNHTRTSEIIRDSFSKSDSVEIESEIPFSSETKFSSIVVNDKESNEKYELTLGAPEVLFPDNTQDALEITKFQNKGLRVIALARKVGSKRVLLGYFVLQEELRKNILDVFSALKDKGVEYKIISGDNPMSVLAVANNIGLKINKNEILSGLDIKSMSNKELIKKLPLIKIFGRMTPDDKERVVELLKLNNYVAMVGDGINDLLPIKKANLGIVLQSGAQATKLASDLILLNDDYNSLINCIGYGQVSKFILNSLYGIFATRFIYLSVLYMALSLSFKFLPFTVIHTSLISLLSVGLGIVFMFAIINKYQITWPTLNRNEFIIPTALLTTILSLSLVIDLRNNYQTISNSATALVVFLVFCALGLNILTILPSKKMLNGPRIKYLLTLLLSQIFIFIFLLIIINNSITANIWSLTRLSINEYKTIAIYCGLWLIGTFITYRLDYRAHQFFDYIHIKFFGWIKSKFSNLSKK